MFIQKLRTKKKNTFNFFYLSLLFSFFLLLTSLSVFGVFLCCRRYLSPCMCFFFCSHSLFFCLYLWAFSIHMYCVRRPTQTLTHTHRTNAHCSDENSDVLHIDYKQYRQSMVNLDSGNNCYADKNLLQLTNTNSCEVIDSQRQREHQYHHHHQQQQHHHQHQHQQAQSSASPSHQHHCGNRNCANHQLIGQYNKVKKNLSESCVINATARSSLSSSPNGPSSSSHPTHRTTATISSGPRTPNASSSICNACTALKIRSSCNIRNWSTGGDSTDSSSSNKIYFSQSKQPSPSSQVYSSSVPTSSSVAHYYSQQSEKQSIPAAAVASHFNQSPGQLYTRQSYPPAAIVADLKNVSNLSVTNLRSTSGIASSSAPNASSPLSSSSTPLTSSSPSYAINKSTDNNYCLYKYNEFNECNHLMHNKLNGGKNPLVQKNTFFKSFARSSSFLNGCRIKVNSRRLKNISFKFKKSDKVHQQECENFCCGAAAAASAAATGAVSSDYTTAGAVAATSASSARGSIGQHSPSSNPVSIRNVCKTTSTTPQSTSTVNTSDLKNKYNAKTNENYYKSAENQLLLQENLASSTGNVATATASGRQHSNPSVLSNKDQYGSATIHNNNINNSIGNTKRPLSHYSDTYTAAYRPVPNTPPPADSKGFKFGSVNSNNNFNNNYYNSSSGYNNTNNHPNNNSNNNSNRNGQCHSYSNSLNRHTRQLSRNKSNGR